MPEKNLSSAGETSQNPRMIRFPRSSLSRRDPGHLRLVSSVDLCAPAGLQLRGRFARPGSQVELDALPRPAVVLEDAGRIGDPAAKTLAERRRSFASLWILWRFDFDALEWIEVIRAKANDASFLIDFAPIARRLLEGDGERVPATEARPAAARAICSIEEELAGVSGDAGCYVLAEVEVYLANQIVRRIEQRSARMLAMAEASFLAMPEAVQAA